MVRSVTDQSSRETNTDCQRFRELFASSDLPPKGELKEYIEHRRQCKTCRRNRLGILVLPGQAIGSDPSIERRISGEVPSPPRQSLPKEPEPLSVEPRTPDQAKSEFEDMVLDLQKVLKSSGC